MKLNVLSDDQNALAREVVWERRGFHPDHYFAVPLSRIGDLMTRIKTIATEAGGLGISVVPEIIANHTVEGEGLWVAGCCAQNGLSFGAESRPPGR